MVKNNTFRNDLFHRLNSFKIEIPPLRERFDDIKLIFDYYLKDFLNIDTKLIKSSDVNIDHDLKSQDKVIALSKSLDADVYINPEGGKELYCRKDFDINQINLKFHIFSPEPYKQFSREFVSHLSIIDMMMFCDFDELSYKLNHNFKVDQILK